MIAEAAIDGTLGIVIGVATLGGILVGFVVRAISAGHDAGKRDARIDAHEKSVTVLFKRVDELREHSVTHNVFKDAIEKMDKEINTLRQESRAILEAIAKLDLKVELMLHGFTPKPKEQ